MLEYQVWVDTSASITNKPINFYRWSDQIYQPYLHLGIMKSNKIDQRRAMKSNTTKSYKASITAVIRDHRDQA